MTAWNRFYFLTLAILFFGLAILGFYRGDREIAWTALSMSLTVSVVSRAVDLILERLNRDE